MTLIQSRTQAYSSLLVLTGIVITLNALCIRPETACAAEPRRGAGTASRPESFTKVWEERVVIPTYKIGPADPNPMFYTHESYQGAQKRIYPYALQDNLTDVREDQTYTVLFLENEYVKLSVLPELGGRIFSALDKANNYDFFYRQHVIKPALIGMLGAWISGGVEWCAFHHHRNTTFMPVDYRLAENPNGSKTIWIGQTEHRHRMRWLIGLTVHPGKSYVEATVKFFNRTAVPHSILYWANVAVHANENYQVIFPPSVQVATYHSKIDFTRWPISSGWYRGHDYKGVDVSWWKNSPVSNSFFAWDLQDDFMGGYDHGKQAGVVHVADHHVVCGAKLWEWGSSSIWDTKILTDSDGPYAELMVGALSDNQPDYSWIKPYQVKSFKQYWYPISQIGGFKNANLNGAVNLEFKPDNVVVIGFQTTSKHSNAKAILKVNDKIIFEQRTEISPAKPFTTQIAVPAGTKETDMRVWLLGPDGEELIAYQPTEPRADAELPKPVKAPPRPQDVNSIEELYLTGLRVEQINSPSVDPLDYYKEALKREPQDSRCNTMVAIDCIKRGMFELAEEHLRTAIKRLSAEYTRPQNAEAYYYLGVTLRAQEKLDEAIDNLHRATWDYAFQSAAYQQLAELSCSRGQFAQAIEYIDRSLSTNSLNTKALNIKAAILRKLGRPAESEQVARAVLSQDQLDFFAMNELHLAQSDQRLRSGADKTLANMKNKMRGDVQSYLELATDYMNCGLLDDAISVLSRPVEMKMDFAGTYPMVHYYLGYLYERKGNRQRASQCYSRASKMPSDYCFPFRLEGVAVLRAAIKHDPSDAKAHYYLGNLLFDLQPEAALACWEQSKTLDDKFAMAHRNLGWAYYRIKDDVPSAIECYEKAVACNQQDPRLFLELDTVYEAGNVAPERRLAALEKSHEVLAKRGDSLAREIAVLVLTGTYDKAIEYLSTYRFHAREGGGEIHNVYVDAHLLRGLQYMSQSNADKALDHFRKAGEYPENLAVERPKSDRRAAQVACYVGMALEASGQIDQARASYKQAADQGDTANWPEARFYQALCLGRLGEKERAGKIFDELIESGNKSLAREEQTDFFAKFGEQQRKIARQAAAHFTLGLGFLGKGQAEEAKEHFKQATTLNTSHVWARHILSQSER